MNGKIKTVKSKGFGFIETNLGIDFFFHSSEFQGDFKELLRNVALGMKPEVTFEQDEKSDQGPRALKVILV